MPSPRPPALTALLTVLVLPWAGTGCRDHQEKARGQLQSAAFSFTVGDFLKAAGEGRTELVAQFLDAGMNADVARADGSTALLSAAAQGRGETVMLLLIRGAAHTTAGPEGVTPLMAAVRSGDERSVSALLQAGADPAQRNAAGETPLLLASSLGHAVLVGILAPLSKEPLDEALRLACTKGHTAVMDVLLNAGAQLDLPGGEKRRTPLMLAAMAGQLPAVKLLCHRQALLAAHDADQLTAADLARKAGHQATANFLQEWTVRHPDGMGGGTSDEMLAAAGLPVLNSPFSPGFPTVAAGPDTAVDAPTAGDAGNPSAARAAAGSGSAATTSPQALPQGVTVAASFSPVNTAPTPPQEAEPEPEQMRSLGTARFPRLRCDSMDDVPGLMRMTAYQLRPWPFVLWDVNTDHESADVELTLEGNRKVNVRKGSTIPGTDCVVEKMRRRRVFDGTKAKKLANVSELTFRSNRTGEVFTAGAGRRVLSSDSSALIRITGSGIVWTAGAGDGFRLGTLLLQLTTIDAGGLTVENRLTRETVRVPLTP
ncbi:MAG: hypothetical protein EOP86_04150 [Verrucomicrobiaceae bacterium]|nr:MAG: hypothetical protein EOP86_04150 [Verrucomicrobiaceae bacterium]